MFLKGMVGGVLMHSLPASVGSAEKKQRIFRHIPSSQQAINAVGLGTWQTFSLSQREASTAVMKRFSELGGELVDTSPMYGEAEQALGEISTQLDLNRQLFIATKVWTSGSRQGRDQIERSHRLLKKRPLDLIQVHNLQDWETHLPYLNELKQQAALKYVGVTHYVNRAHEPLEQVISNHPIDFLQVNYNIANRHAEQRLLPRAQDRGVAVIVNRPYGEGQLFRRVKGQGLPGWASEIECQSWAQIFLKFILSHPAVTCVIPATSKVHHLEDNMAAGYGPLPDAEFRELMARTFESL
jgi:aryl-alcohol dehydrogenase-like predicted oxidoreductase